MRVFFSKKFRKTYNKLDISIREKFKARVRLFKENKFNELLRNHSVDPPYKNTRSINITGDYRALFIEMDGDAIFFTNIGAHGELYS